MFAKMYDSCAKMSNLKEATKSLATLFHKDLSNMSSIGILLLRGGSGVGERGIESATGGLLSRVNRIVLF